MHWIIDLVLLLIILLCAWRGFRNGLITKEQPTEDVDMLILKVIDAKPEKKRRRSWDRDAR